MTTPSQPPTPQQPQTPAPAAQGAALAHPIRSGIFVLVIVGLVLIWLIEWATPGHSPWIHLLPALAVLGSLGAALTRLGPSRNIEARPTNIPDWDPKRPEESLVQIHLYVLDEAVNSIGWYWRHKGAKALGSQIIRFSVWALAAVGGLLPVMAVVLKGFFSHLDLTKDSQLDLTNGLWASLLLGVAAALVGLDKGFGYSSGWARYVLAATNIRKSLEDFRLDWAALRAKAGTPLTAETAAPLIERAKLFRAEVEGLVMQETKDWVTEFQSTMAQMEKDVAAQLSSLKSQVDKTVKDRADSSQPGYVQLTLKDPNSLFAKSKLTVTLVDSSNQPVKDAQQLPMTSLTWTSPFVASGFYQVKVEGTVDARTFSQTRDTTIKSGAKAAPSDPDITLQ